MISLPKHLSTILNSLFLDRWVSVRNFTKRSFIYCIQLVLLTCAMSITSVSQASRPLAFPYKGTVLIMMAP